MDRSRPNRDARAPRAEYVGTTSHLCHRPAHARRQPPRCRQAWIALSTRQNGLLGIGPYPTDGGGRDPDLINAGKKPSHDCPGLLLQQLRRLIRHVRGVEVTSVAWCVWAGNIYLTVLGARQVDAEGNLANWMIPRQAFVVKGLAGAMEIWSPARVG